MRASIVLLVLLFLAVPVHGKVRVEFDETVDFSTYETFAWKITPSTSLDEDAPDIHIRIVRGLEHYLREGLEEVEEDPDLWVTYHARTHTDLRVDTTQMGYMYGNGWFWDPNWGGGYGSNPSVAHARTYKKGTLVVDIIDASNDEIVWRGISEGKLSENRDKVKRNIDNIIHRMVRKFEKKYKGK